MNPQLILAFFGIASEIISKYQAAHHSEMPTPEAMLEEFNGNVDKYLAEGAAWRKTHPAPPSSGRV